MGVNNFVEIFDEQYYEDLGGGILEAFGKMFYNNLKVYIMVFGFYHLQLT